MNKLSFYAPIGSTLGTFSLILFLLPRFSSSLGLDNLLFITSRLNGIFLFIFIFSYIAAYKMVKQGIQRCTMAGLFGLIFALAFFYPQFFGKEGFMFGFYSMFYVYIASYLGWISYLGFDWNNRMRRERELEKANLQSELTLLKNQINPHFLFNTLNNIDSLIKSNPDKASTTLVELSDMMRYMIYETNDERVPLSQELAYIENYLNLQKIQYHNTNLVNYEVSGDVAGVQKVAPMLFISFIENAFKHCTDKEREHAISISFVITGNVIYFRAGNIVDRSHKISKDKSSGIGLETVKRRLEIIYPNKYELSIDEKNKLYCVSLKIDTND